jgi:hypothetical protein
LVGGVLNSIDSNLFTFTPPILAQDTIKIDTFWVTKNSDGFLTISAPVGTANLWVYNMVLRMRSISNATDTATKDFNFVVSI